MLLSTQGDIMCDADWDWSRRRKPKKVLLKDNRGLTREGAVIKSNLTLEQLDRFYRAAKVWLLPETKTFEYEDHD